MSGAVTISVDHSCPGLAQPLGQVITKQGPFCVWHGLTFGRWLNLLAQRPRIDRAHVLRAASITAVSLVNSLQAAAESLLFGQLKQVEISQHPIFILGHWRSGTTLLHNLLTLDPQFAYPNLYQVLFSGHFLTTERVVARLTAHLIPKTRLIDDMPAGWNMTQEDEIALLLTTGLSPYLMTVFQGDRSRYGRYFSLSDVSPSELEFWKRSFLLFLKKLTYRYQGRQIVLKSPSHTYRIPILLEMFPQAKFVYIYRNPYAVFNSTLHLRRTMFTENGLAMPNFDGLEEDSFVTYEDCVRTYERTKSLIPPGQLHEVSFEQLEADPLGQMRALYEAWHQDGWSGLEPKLTQKLPELARHRKNKFSMDDALRRRIYRRLRWMFELYGYPSGLPEHAASRPLSAAG
jgi:hypothetical protein